MSYLPANRKDFLTDRFFEEIWKHEEIKIKNLHWKYQNLMLSEYKVISKKTHSNIKRANGRIGVVEFDRQKAKDACIFLAWIASYKQENLTLFDTCFDSLAAFDSFNVIVEFPIFEKVLVTIPRLILEKDETSLDYILHQISLVVLEIYTEPKKYGVWGHSFESLEFTDVEIYANGFLQVNINGK